MTTTDNSWRAFFTSGGLAIAVFIGGIGLQAIETFIGTAMLPTIVRDIGGLDLFAWSTTLFVVASIGATVFSAARPHRIGPRDIYVLAAIAFGSGSLVCGFAPNMAQLLVGRTIQGFGAGLLIATTLAMIRIVFPQHLWPRAMALNSIVWGVTTLLGPAIGGILANYGLWRWAFFTIVPLSTLLVFGAVFVLPARKNSVPQGSAPIPQVGLVMAAILLISIASVQTSNAPVAALLLVLSGLAVAVLAWVERRSPRRLLPEGSLTLGTSINTLFATILLLGISVSSDVFAPLFFQRLHGLSPLWAGYATALLAAGWTISSVITAGFSGARVRAVIVAAPAIVTLATIGLALSLATANAASDPVPIALAGFSMLLAGGGIGSAFQHLFTSVLAMDGDADSDRVSAALGMVQLFASGIGAAIGGLVVNAASLPTAADNSSVETAAHWLYWIFAALTALAIPLAWRVVRTAPP